MSRIHPAVSESFRKEIAAAGGREVSFVAELDADGALAAARAVARGTVEAVLALPGVASRGEMLVQNHRSIISDYYGLTTSFMRERLKPGVTILADEEVTPWTKYIHGEYGSGTFKFFGGHDPEDQKNRIGDPPTDLSLHPNSPGYRLILNNVLFPAAKKRELKT